MRALYAAGCVACLLFAVAVMWTASYAESPPARPPATGTTTTTVPAIAPLTPAGPVRPPLAGVSRGVAGIPGADPPVIPQT